MEERKITEMAAVMRRKILDVSHHCNMSAHLGGGLSMVEITATLYGSVLRILEWTIAAYDRLGVVREREGNRLANERHFARRQRERPQIGARLSLRGLAHHAPLPEATFARISIRTFFQSALPRVTSLADVKFFPPNGS